MINLSARSKEEELMDDLGCTGEVVHQTLRELHTINTLLGGNAISIHAFKKLVKDKDDLTLVDVGCGGGDILMVLAKWCRKKKKKVKFIGIDANASIITYAKENCQQFPEISFKAVNIFSKEFKAMDFDLLHCCLFTHHFGDTDLVTLFAHFHQKARVGVIINDLHRHPLAYFSIKYLTHFFSQSAMVRYDAALSVARGFKKKEIVGILKKAGINDFQLSWKWAFRWKIIY